MNTLYRHQAAERDEHASDAKRALFWSPRCGKTLGVIASMLTMPRLKRGIVVAPLVVCPQWADQLEEAGYRVIRAYELNRGELMREVRKARMSGQGGMVVVGWRRLASQTAEERKTGKTSEVTQVLLDYSAQAVVLDESHNMAAPSSGQGKVARRLAWAAPWVRLLTGTPAPNHYGSLWGQLVALDRELFGKSFEQFARSYLIRDTMYPSRILGHINSADLQAKMLRYVSIVRREDVFGPDAWVEDVREIDLPAAARKAYDALASAWLIDDPELDLHVSADHVLKRLVRLQQVAAGYVPEDTGSVRLLHDEKIEAVLSDLEEIVASDDKAVVFHRFRWEGEEIARRAVRLGVPVLRISGDTPAEDRAAVIARMERPGSAVAIVQTKSGGVGISFAEVPYQLVVSQSFSFVDEEQRHDRTFKPNTARFVRYYRVRDTVDVFIADMLTSKEGIHNSVKNADREILAYGRIRKPTQKRSRAL